ncbi:GNAT family N-acetyltransferase [Lachnospiraceae bacterium 29-84]
MYEAKERKCQKIILITTNDNINAIKFYQKRGFDMTHLFRNALDISRKLKQRFL